MRRPTSCVWAADPAPSSTGCATTAPAASPPPHPRHPHTNTSSATNAASDLRARSLLLQEDKDDEVEVNWEQEEEVAEGTDYDPKGDIVLERERRPGACASSYPARTKPPPRMDPGKKTNRIEVQEKPMDIGPEAMDSEGIKNSVSCEQPTEGQLEFVMSRHNKPKKVNTPVIRQDISITQYIMSVPPKTKLVVIGDAVLSVEDLACLINGGVYLDDSVINAYIYCIRVQEHLWHRAVGNVHLETTYVSAILKRDGKLDIAPSDHGHIIWRVHNYLQHGMVYIPVNIKNCHWYLEVVNAKMCEIQVLDSFGPDVLAGDDLTLILQGLKSILILLHKAQILAWATSGRTWMLHHGQSKNIRTSECRKMGDELSDNVTPSPLP